MTHRRGYSDRIHHAFAFAAKRRPMLREAGGERRSGPGGLVRSASVAVLLVRYEADEATVVAAILKHLLEETAQGDRLRVGQDVLRRFGPEVVEIIDETLDPPRQLHGRRRPWKAHRLDALGRLARASVRAADVMAAEVIHDCGSLLVDVRRLGKEYVPTWLAADPSDAVWWFDAVAETLSVHERWSRPPMLKELREYARVLRMEIGTG